MNTVISVKLLKPEAVVLPNGYIIAPVLIPFSKVVPGWSAPVPVHEMDEEYIYKVTLKDEAPHELPPHIEADDDLRRQFTLHDVERQANNYNENNKVRRCLELEAAAGRIKILHDSFLDPHTSIPKNPSIATMATDKDGLAVQNELRQQRKREDMRRGKTIESPKPKPHAKAINLDGSEVTEDQIGEVPVKRGPGRPAKITPEE